jgi:hypothetical protein
MSQKYPHLKIRYYFENFDNTHYIFLEPINDYLDGEFGIEAYNFDINEFIPSFPYETIAFLPMEEYEEEFTNSLIFDNLLKNQFSIEPKKISHTFNNLFNNKNKEIIFNNNIEITNSNDYSNLILNFNSFNNQLQTKNLENAA